MPVSVPVSLQLGAKLLRSLSARNPHPTVQNHRLEVGAGLGVSVSGLPSLTGAWDKLVVILFFTEEDEEPVEEEDPPASSS